MAYYHDTKQSPEETIDSLYQKIAAACLAAGDVLTCTEIVGALDMVKMAIFHSYREGIDILEETEN